MDINHSHYADYGPNLLRILDRTTCLNEEADGFFINPEGVNLEEHFPILMWDDGTLSSGAEKLALGFACPPHLYDEDFDVDSDWVTVYLYGFPQTFMKKLIPFLSVAALTNIESDEFLSENEVFRAGFRAELRERSANDAVAEFMEVALPILFSTASSTFVSNRDALMFEMGWACGKLNLAAPEGL
ncbi:hypothetical protein [Microbacterium sp. p3-SID336]|uniref:hypothetical protein n=1 Tax=Microbacterium sp. p3-SID336 TaxID=2916212 RepID=UPI0021A2A778|nr:hypothetical protein [Microbacterium sp. p3-SID336]MCT1478317.1 hypothetical protein [Microbacterium sp. p3-SID336]